MDKPGPSKRLRSAKISCSGAKKPRRVVILTKEKSDDSSLSNECSSEQVVYSRCDNEEVAGVKIKEESDQSDCSISDTHSQPPEFCNFATRIKLSPTAELELKLSPSSSYDIDQCRYSEMNLQMLSDCSMATSTGLLSENQSDFKQPSQQGSTSTWSTNCVMKTIEFSKTQELLVPAPSDPLEMFRLLFDDDILDLIVRETNLNAKRILEQPNNKAKSRIKSWKELTRQELLTFLGLLIHTGTIRLNRLNDYWKKHWLFNIPCFGQYMARNRYMLILKCLNFSSEPSVNDRLAKIRPVINHFNDRMNNIYSPGKELFLDKSMVLWCGCLFFRQQIKNKQYKNGVKLYVLAEPQGILLKFQMYADASDETSDNEHSQKIVLKLLEETLDCGHSVYMDKNYNSYDLAVKLLDRQTYCTGTLKENSKGNPIDLATVTLNKGENKSLFLNGVHIGKWRDKRYVLYISTEHDDKMMQVTNKSKQVIVKPSAIVHYNNFTSGVKLQDQILSYYPCERIRLCWYKKMFIHTLQMSLSNAFYLYNKYCTSEKMTLYDFRLSILEKLLPNKSPSSRSILKIGHKLTKIDNVKIREKKEADRTRIIKEVIRRDCKSCRAKKKRVPTLFECKGCDGSPAYCTDCFCEVHS